MLCSAYFDEECAWRCNSVPTDRDRSDSLLSGVSLAHHAPSRDGGLDCQTLNQALSMVSLDEPTTFGRLTQYQ